MSRILIVGQGIAGSLAAWELGHRGHSVTVVADSSRDRASDVAAGILNPVTGKRLVKTWNAEGLLSAARATYRAIEQTTAHRFFHEQSIFRIYRSADEEKRWEKRRGDAAYADFVGKREVLPDHLAVANPHGGFTIDQVGYVDTRTLTTALADWIHHDHTLIDTAFRHRDMAIETDAVAWRGMRYDRVVFCEGWHIGNNPWFDWLPFRHAKGEILDLRLADPPPDQILSGGKWLLPIGKHHYRLGSTWSWDHLDNQPTGIGKAALLKGLRDMTRLTAEPEIIAHAAGVRPCSDDAMPFIGAHPDNDRLWVLNGLSSKGAFYGPYAANYLAERMSDKRSIENPIAVERIVRPRR